MGGYMYGCVCPLDWGEEWAIKIPFLILPSFPMDNPYFSGLYLYTNKTMPNLREPWHLSPEGASIMKVSITLFSHSLTALTRVNSNFFIRNFLHPSLGYCNRSLCTLTLFLKQASCEGFSFLESHICVAFCYQNTETTIVDSRMLHKIQLRCSGHQLCFHSSCNNGEKF